MTTVECVMGVTPDRVFDVLADGWSYPLWVVGATHMRDVDDAWPAVGARLHHRVGAWPLTLQDRTEVLEVEPGRRLVLRAHGWPGGSARIELELEPAGEGGTLVRMRERADQGPGALVPGVLQDVLLVPRNREALQRLRSVAEHRRR